MSLVMESDLKDKNLDEGVVAIQGIVVIHLLILS